MNLLDKNWLRLLVVAALAFFSCEDSSDIGLGLDPDGVRLDVLYTELPLTATNVRIDSIRTNADSRLLVGRSTDPIFGEIVSKSFCRMFFKNGLTVGDTSLMNDRDLRGKQIYFIDSAVLYLQISKVHTANFSAAQTYTVHQLEDTIFSGTARYLSRFQTPYNETVEEARLSITLSESQIKGADTVEYMVNTHMSETFADRLFSYVEDDQASSANKLFYDYKGIAIVGDPANTALVGFQPADSTSIRIFYSIRDHYLDGNSEEADSLWADSLSLDIGLNSAYYNGWSVDRSGALMNASTGEYNSFTVGDGNIYLQPISGVYPKVNLDTLVSFFEANPSIQINRMELVAETSLTEGEFQENVSDLRFVYVDSTDGSRIDPSGFVSGNLFQTAILSDNGYLANILDPIVAPLDETSLTYSEIPTFFAQLVESGTLEVEHVILMPQDVTTPDFSIFDEETGFRIKLYYSLPE